MDPYEELGVPKGADRETVSKAYKRRARKLHPDRNKDPNAGEAMARCNLARDILIDPVRRARFDSTGNAGNALDPDQEAIKMVMLGMHTYLMDGKRRNIPKAVQRQLVEALGKGKAMRGDFRRERKRLEEIRGDVETDDPHNLFDKLVESALEQLDAKDKALAHDITVIERAIEIVKLYRSGVLDSPDFRPGSLAESLQMAAAAMGTHSGRGGYGT